MCNCIDHILHSLWCNCGYSVEKGLCENLSHTFDFFKCILLQDVQKNNNNKKKIVHVAGQSLGRRLQKSCVNGRQEAGS